MKNILVPLVIDKQVQSLILDFVCYSDKKFWNANTTEGTKNRFFCKISDFTNLFLSQIIKDVADSFYKKLGVYDYEYEYMFGNFIGVNKEGGNVHPHSDPPNKDGWYHTRLNCLIQKPQNGGMPVVDGVEYNINEGQVWFNNASLWEHGSTVVRGEVDRIVLSLGSYIKPDDFLTINQNILNNKNA